MTTADLQALLAELTSLPNETEWAEFKHNNADPEEIGEYISALANASALHGRECAYIVWGVEDSGHAIVGTSFKPRHAKVGGEELENWLVRLLHPRAEFIIHEFDSDGRSIVIFEIRRCLHTPIRFRETEYIRVGSYKKKLRDFPEKERFLWAQLSAVPFERRPAATSVTSDDVVRLLDYPAYFELMHQNLPADKAGILERLAKEKLVVAADNDRWDVTNLGALLFAKHVEDFESVSRKAVRVINYKSNDRIDVVKERVGTRGYAAAFQRLISYLNDQLPRNEQIVSALRKEVRVYPEIAIRELVANALIHQDFSLKGDGPMIEIFSDRIEITNPGRPLIDVLRFIDEPPQSRNEAFASFMRRLNVCEERGSGIDKVIFQVEFYQLPAPNFLVTENHTKAILFAPRKLSSMDRKDKIRACYQHAALLYVSNQMMTNASLRKRLSIEEKNYAIASRIIADTIHENLVKPYDPESFSRKHARYVPFWA